MILKANQIANRMLSIAAEDKADPLAIVPFPDVEELRKSGSASVNLRLGTWFTTLRQSRIPVLDFDHTQAAVSKLAKFRHAATQVGLTPVQLETLEKLLPKMESPTEDQLTKRHYVSFGSRFILHPGNFVLGITLEWLRIPRDLAGYVVGRSSWGRRGLIIATAAGVHPGFTGCLTLELTNVGETPIAIKPGMQICQLFLHAVDTKTDPEVDRSAFGFSRRPSLGRIKLDNVAEQLAKGRY